MALHSQFIDIKYLEASHHSPHTRTTFKLPNGIVAFPNLRICNLGIHGAVGRLSETGISSLIKHISLYSDSQLIDQLRYANQFESFRQLTHSNSVNNDNFSYLEKSEIGYSINSSQQVESLNNGHSASIVELTETDAQGGYLQLPSLLRILQEKSFVIDTNKFKNMSIVIEWATDKLHYLSEGTNETFSIGNPTLVYDQVIDEKLARSMSAGMKNFSWNCIDHDSITVSAQTTLPTTQTLTRKLKGFDTKYLNRLVIVKNFINNTINVNTDVANTMKGKGYYRSPVQHNEQIQLKVNGMCLFDEPIIQENVKAMITAQAWGPLNLRPYEGNISVGLDNLHEGYKSYVGIPADRNNIVGFGSYFGMDIKQSINDLEIEYRRNCTEMSAGTENRYAEGLLLNVFGEVTKQIIFNNNGFVVRYL